MKTINDIHNLLIVGTVCWALIIGILVMSIRISELEQKRKIRQRRNVIEQQEANIEFINRLKTNA